jgi:N-acetylglutamate synthase-like GNAT family acetyltransferase
MTVRMLSKTELSWANELYAQIDFQPSSEHDFIVVAEVEGTRAALGRVVTMSSSCGELGGMYVLPAFRGNALSGTVIEFLINNCGLRTLYCIPFAHLSALYARHGFVTVPEGTEVPEKVKEKFEWCKANYPTPVTLMACAASFDRNA